MYLGRIVRIYIEWIYESTNLFLLPRCAISVYQDAINANSKSAVHLIISMSRKGGINHARFSATRNKD